jgi:hypothetical protein
MIKKYHKIKNKVKTFTILVLLALQSISFMVSIPAVEAQTIIFVDDFESNDLRKWDDTVATYGESVSAYSYAPYEGDHHARYASDGSGSSDNAYTSVDVNEEEIHVSGYFYPIIGMPLRDEDDRFYFVRLQGDGQSLAAAGIRRRNGVDNWIIFARDGSGWVGPEYSSSPGVEEKWYRLELHWVKDSRDGYVELYVDGRRVLELTGLDTDNYGNVDAVNIGLVSATGVQQDMIVYSDLIEISSTSDASEPTPEPTPEPPSTDGTVHGVTYMSDDWRYRESDSVYRRDFQLFKEHGITVICLLTHWQDFEPSQGYFDSSLFRRMNNVAEIADDYGISVIYNVHTTYSGYDVPRYVRNFRYLFTSSSLYDAHLNALQEFCRRLDGPNVIGFQIHNEPVNADWGIDAGVEAWTELFRDSVAACREVTNKPISIRIAAGSFRQFDDRVFDIFDFMSINYYEEWHSESDLRSAVQKTHQRDKIVVISEYGLSSRDDRTQAEAIADYLELFEELDVEYSTVWWYCPLSGPSSNNYNVFDDSSNQPRTAFYEIGAAN